MAEESEPEFVVVDTMTELRAQQYVNEEEIKRLKTTLDELKALCKEIEEKSKEYKEYWWKLQRFVVAVGGLVLGCTLDYLCREVGAFNTMFGPARNALLFAGICLGATILLSVFDDEISRYHPNENFRQVVEDLGHSKDVVTEDERSEDSPSDAEESEEKSHAD